MCGARASGRQRRWPVAGPAEGRGGWDQVGAARRLAMGLPPGVCRPTRGRTRGYSGEIWVFARGLEVHGSSELRRPRGASGSTGRPWGRAYARGLWGPREASKCPSTRVSGGPRAAPSPRSRESTGRPRKCALRPGCQVCCLLFPALPE